jgi:hypothetical protein
VSLSPFLTPVEYALAHFIRVSKAFFLAKPSPPSRNRPAANKLTVFGTPDRNNEGNGGGRTIFNFAGEVMSFTSRFRYKGESAPALGFRSMARFNKPIEPATLGNIKENGGQCRVRGGHMRASRL